MNIDKNNRPQLSINYRPVSNTNLIISNYLENQQQTKHKYFVPQADRPSVFGLNIIQSNLQNKSSEILTSTRTAPNENFILNNGFLKPKAIPTSASVNSNFSKSEYFNGSSSSISTQKSNLIKSRLKSSNKTLQNTSGTSVTNLTSEENNIDKLLGSKKARDAFFERLRVTEYFNQTKNVTELSKPTTKTVRSGSGSSKSSDAKTKFYDLKKISFMSHTENHLDTDSLSNSSISGNAINHLNNPNLQVSSTMSLFSKPYSLKTNFSNVTLIDKQFKKAEISVDHAYFYQNSKTNISYQNIKENTHNHNEPGKISLSSIETDKASKNESSYSDPLSQNSRESENSRENKNSRMPNRIKESPVGNMQPSSHRERIDNLLIRRNITTNPVSHTLKLDAEYDTKNRVIQIKTVENKNESPIISTKGTDVNDTNTTTLEVKLVETAQVNERESATTSASSMSSSYSVNGFSSSKNSNSNLNEKSKISASFDNCKF